MSLNISFNDLIKSLRLYHLHYNVNTKLHIIWQLFRQQGRGLLFMLMILSEQKIHATP